MRSYASTFLSMGRQSGVAYLRPLSLGHCTPRYGDTLCQDGGEPSPSSMTLKMHPQLIGDWRKGHEAVSQFSLEEAGRQTTIERFALLRAFLRRLCAIAHLAPRKDDQDFRLRWHRVREAVLGEF